MSWGKRANMLVESIEVKWNGNRTGAAKQSNVETYGKFCVIRHLGFQLTVDTWSE